MRCGRIDLDKRVKVVKVVKECIPFCLNDYVSMISCYLCNNDCLFAIRPFTELLLSGRIMVNPTVCTFQPLFTHQFMCYIAGN